MSAPRQNRSAGSAGRAAMERTGSGRKGSGGSGGSGRVKVTTDLKDLPKELADLCGPCCNPGYDAGLNKPQFNSSGAPYQAPVSSERFFARGSGGGFRAGSVKKRTAYMPGAVHSVEDKEAPKRKPVDAKPSFKPSSGVGDLFSVETGLGPADQSAAPRARTGGLKVGSYKPKKAPMPDEYHAQREFRYVAEPDRSETMEAPPFKAGAPGKDFFDSAMLMSEPVGDAREPPPKRPLAGAWKPHGKPSRDAIGKFPKGMPDPYGIRPPPGAESRHRGAFGICCVPAGGGRTVKPIAWYKTRTGDVFRTRDLRAAAAAAGYAHPEKLDVAALTRQTMRGTGATIIQFDRTV
uniref:Uncharacterized protein n=1 Tax=Bicosoecida sp. CB-2014 TaxID=1486930 RepID=A0A7S1GFC8_9STRA|mmetsp:Transcript_9626/g.33849  ORF Transcript_9626/g.33849 Transcript_9626/m.33849 type:complete len:349 (+) Transcript_9626:178-1224(+)